MYIIEGNIGAGKSTFLKKLNEHLPTITATQEPLDNWQKQVYGQSLLTNFYQNPRRWAYTLETLAMISRVQEHRREQECSNTLRVMERSIYSGHYCFTKNSYETGLMSEIEWHVYIQWFNFLIPGKCKPPHGFIYLQTDPEVSYERIKKRNRLAEQDISLAYIRQIDRRHRDFLLKKEGVLPEIAQTPVLILDANQEFETDKAVFTHHLKKVVEFITGITPAISQEKCDLQEPIGYV